MVGTALTAVYFLILINRTFFGRLPDSLAQLPRVRWQDRMPSIVVTLVIIVLGLQPNWMVRWTEATTTALSEFSMNRTLTAALAPSESSIRRQMAYEKSLQPPVVPEISVSDLSLDQ
jgi:NAD(P)H-quinone oxidoreductase subunit 4